MPMEPRFQQEKGENSIGEPNAYPLVIRKADDVKILWLKHRKTSQ